MNELTKLQLYQCCDASKLLLGHYEPTMCNTGLKAQIENYKDFALTLGFACMYFAY